MAQAHGFDNTVVFAKEAVYGTASSTASDYKWIGLVDSFEPEESNNIDSRMSIGSRAPIQLRVGAKEVDASISMAIQNGRIFGYGLGKVATTGDGTAGYTHTCTPIGKGEELPSFTVQNHNTELTFTRNYLGGKVDSFTVSASAEEAVMVEADMLFQAMVDSGTVQTVTAETTPYYMFYESQVKIGGTNIANCSEFEVEVSNNLERKFSLNNTNKPTRIEAGNLEITASLTLDFDGVTEWTKFRDGTALSVDLVLVDPTSSGKRSITIALTGGLYDSNSIAVGAEDMQTQELEAVFTGITITVKDATAATLL